MSSHVICKFPLVLLIVLVLTLGVQGAENKPLKVLFIGNSYTYENNLPFVFQSLARPLCEVKFEMVAEGGATLRRHLSRGDIQKRIAEGQYDVVVAQEQSRLGTQQLVEGFSLLTDTTAFHDSVREIAKSARIGKSRIVLLSHWPRADEPRNLTPIHNAYVTIAKEVNAIIAPVGLVWDKLGGDACSELKLYGEDRSHPAPEGTYVAAATLVRAVLDESPHLVAVTSVPMMDGRAKLNGEFVDIALDKQGVDAVNRVLDSIYKRDSSVEDAILPNYPPIPLPKLPPGIMRSRLDKSFLKGTWEGDFTTFGLSNRATITLNFHTEPAQIRMIHDEEWSPNDETSTPLKRPGEDGTLKLVYSSTAKNCIVDITLVRVGEQLKGLVRFIPGDGKEWVRSAITLSRQAP